MPMKPKRPFSYPRCPRLTDGRFCKEHEKKEIVTCGEDDLFERPKTFRENNLGIANTS